MARKKKSEPPKIGALPKREPQQLTFTDTVEILNRALDLFVAAQIKQHPVKIAADLFKQITTSVCDANENFEACSKEFLKTVEAKFWK